MIRKKILLILLVLSILISSFASSQMFTGEECITDQDCIQILTNGFTPEDVFCGEDFLCYISDSDEEPGIPEGLEDLVEEINDTESLDLIEVIGPTGQTYIEIKNLESQISLVRAENINLKNQFSSLFSEVQLTQGNINSLQAQVNGLQQKVDAISDKVESSMIEVESSVMTGFASLMQEINTTKTEVAQLERDLTERKMISNILLILFILAIGAGVFYFVTRKKITGVNREIINYITEHIKQGIKFPNIKENLLQAGWSHQEIDQAYKKTIKHNYQKYLKKRSKKTPVSEPMKRPTTSPTRKKFDPKKVAVISVVSIILLIVGFYVLKTTVGQAMNIQETYKHSEPLICTPPHIITEGGCCLDNNNNTICDNIEEYEKEKAEVSAEVCYDHNDCGSGELCIDNSCGTFQKTDLYNQTTCSGQSCNVNNIDILTGDDENYVLPPRKGSYTAAGALAWTLRPVPNYCKGEQLRIPIEIDKIGLVCYDKLGEKISCQQNTGMKCSNDADCTTTSSSSGLKEEITLLANSIDFALANNFIAYLEINDFKVNHVTAQQFQDAKYKESIIILGGPDSPEEIGDIVDSILSESEKELVRKEDSSLIFNKNNLYSSNQEIIVLAGYTKELTQESTTTNKESVVQQLGSQTSQTYCTTTKPCICKKSSGSSTGSCIIDIVEKVKSEILSKEIITLKIGETSKVLSHPNPAVNERLEKFTLKLNTFNEFCFG